MQAEHNATILDNQRVALRAANCASQAAARSEKQTSATKAMLTEHTTVRIRDWPPALFAHVAPKIWWLAATHGNRWWGSVFFSVASRTRPPCLSLQRWRVPIIAPVVGIGRAFADYYDAELELQ